MIGSFALQRRILLTYEQIPPVLKDAILTTEDQHFEQHWGVDFTRVAGAAWRNLLAHRVAEGASTLTMQLAGTLFLDRSDRSMRRKIQETLLAIQIERHYSKQQIFTMYCNQIYLSHGNYGFEAASEYYFGKPVGKLTLARSRPARGTDPRSELFADPARAARACAAQRRAGPHGARRKNHRCPGAAGHRAAAWACTSRRRGTRWRPYFVEEIRKYLESTYGTETVHERGLRVYTTLNVAMQRAANQAIRDGLHAYDRRHGWRGKLDNILSDKSDTLESYEDDDWRWPINKGDYVTAWSRPWTPKPRRSKSARITPCSRSPILPGPATSLPPIF